MLTRRTLLLPILVLLLWTSLALWQSFARAQQAISPFIITDIRVEGLERLQPGTIFNYLPLKVGDELNDEEASLSIRELFATGFFESVSLEQDGTVLVVKVVERPSISEITITGNSTLPTPTIQQGLEQSGLVEGRIFNRAILSQVEQEIKNTYLSLGRYSSRVKTSVEKLERNRIAVTIEIEEGQVATIKKINIIGASQIPVKTIIEQMTLRDHRGWRVFSRRNQYSKQKLEADLEAIRSYYLNRGFHDFQILSTTVDISPNKQNIFISISLQEGARYVFGESIFEIKAHTEVADLTELLTMKAGDTFSRREVNISRAAIVSRYADSGYLFVEVQPIYKANPAKGTVDTIYTIDPKQRVNVRKIEIVGNIYTRDQVIRRELRQFESAWYSSTAIDLSRRRLGLLGFFDQINIETPQVPGVPDQVDMIVSVRERNTGSIAFSLGYSDADGTLLGGSFNQRNLFGSGRELNVNLNTSDTARTLSLNYVDPYHTPTGIRRSISLSRRRLDTDESSSAEYILNSAGGEINYRIPISESNAFNLGFTGEQVTLDHTNATPREFRAIIDTQSVGNNLLVNFGVSRDTRNDSIFPTKGSRTSLSLEASSPGSEFQYYRVNLQGNYYIPLPAGLSFRTHIGLGLGGGYGDTENLPFFRRYHAGGSNSVRGFESRSLGPRSSGAAGPGGCEALLEEQARFVALPLDENDNRIYPDSVRPAFTDEMIDEIVNNIIMSLPEMERTDARAMTERQSITRLDPILREQEFRALLPNCDRLVAPDTIGGNQRLIAGFELLFPPFGASGKDKRFSIFFDSGMVYGDGYEYPTRLSITDPERKEFDRTFGSDLKYSVGVVFNWASPIGPFSMSYAEPLNGNELDETEKFQITVGSTFR